MVAFGIHNPGLIVNRHGVARVSYTDCRRSAEARACWGAINARHAQAGRLPGALQVRLLGRAWVVRERLLEAYAQLLPPVHRPAADSIWWLPATPPMAPTGRCNRGAESCKNGGWVGTARQQAAELHLSHWTGKMAQLFMRHLVASERTVRSSVRIPALCLQGRVRLLGHLGGCTDRQLRPQHVHRYPQPRLGQGLVPLQLRPDTSHRRATSASGCTSSTAAPIPPAAMPTA